MTIISEVARSYVTVTLDTTPPAVGIVGPGRVDPPADISLVVTSSEEVGYVSLAFVDALGEHHEVGFERLSPLSFLVTIPTPGLPLGEGTLWATVADKVSNVAVATHTVQVGASKLAYSVSLSFERGYEVDEGIHHGYEVEVTIAKTGTLAPTPILRSITEALATPTDAAVAVVIPGP